MADTSRQTLIVGASRGLGLGLVPEFLRRGWRVTATARSESGTAAIRALQAGSGGRLTVEHVDINRSDEVMALRERLSPGALDLLFVVAGVGGSADAPISEVPVSEFLSVMETNAYRPVAFVEALLDRVAPDGTIALMSSILGSVSQNTTGQYEAYRASKAALNSLTRSAVGRWGAGRTTLLVHPGWVRTDMGGPHAPLDVETSVDGMVTMIEAQHGRTGHAYLDYQNKEVPW